MINHAILLRLILLLIGFLAESEQNHNLFNDDFYLQRTGDMIPECESVLREFATSTSDYTMCVIKYSRPIRACTQCKDQFMSVRSAHNKILTTEVNGTKCESFLINLDRLQIVESMYNNVQDIWNRGYCDKCFDWKNNTPIVSNQTDAFFDYHSTIMECITTHGTNKNNSQKICKDCMKKYLALNSFYESLKGTSETVGICMDIVDSMNATRSIWSEDLQCCKQRRNPEIVFLACTAFVALLPVMFYLFARIYFDTPNLEPQKADHNRMMETLRSLPSTSHSIQS